MAHCDIVPGNLADWGPYQPRGRVKWRHTHLLSEATKLYEAQSYLVWRYDEFFNTHITITANLMGLVDHRDLTKHMPAFNKELKRWLAIGNDKPCRRWSRGRRTRTSQDHRWIYVLEHGCSNGLHVHQLCVVPKDCWKAFDLLVKDWWWRAAGFDIPDEAIKIRHEEGRTVQSRYERHVEWFRYLIKSVHRDATMIGADGLPWPSEKIFKPKPYWRTMPTYAPQLYGICHSLGPKARREPVYAGSERTHFRSLLALREYQDIYCGWEIGALDAWRGPAALISAMQ